MCVDQSVIDSIGEYGITYCPSTLNTDYLELSLQYNCKLSQNIIHHYLTVWDMDMINLLFKYNIELSINDDSVISYNPQLNITQFTQIITELMDKGLDPIKYLYLFYLKHPRLLHKKKPR